MSSRREAQDATARVRSSQDYGSSLPSRSIFLLPDGQRRDGGNAVGTSRAAPSQPAGRSSVSSATELYSESRSIPLPAGAVVGTGAPANAGRRSTGGRSHAAAQGVRPPEPPAATSNGAADDAEPFARLRRAVADYVGDEEDGPRGRGGGAWMDPGMLDPAASDPVSPDLVDSPMAPPRPLGDTRGSMMNDTLASADIMARMRQEEQELAEFEALERELQQPTRGDTDPRASLESFGAPPPSVRSSYGDTNSWGTMGWSRKDEEGKSGAVDGQDPLADPDEPAPSTRRGPARLSQSTGARNSGRPRTGSGSNSGGRYSHTTATSQGPAHARDTGSQRGRGAANGAAPAADDAPVSSLVSRMFHSQRAPSSRRPASTGSGGRATNAGSKHQQQQQQRRPPRTAAPRAGGEGGTDRVGVAPAAASASLDEVVQARVKELEKEVEQYKAEKRKLGRERAAFIREMEQQREAFEEEKKRHAKELAEERRQLEQQLKSERRVMQRQAKASAMASTNLRKERAVIDGLKAEIAKMKVDENARASKRKVTVSRLNQRIKSLTEQNEELKQQVEFLEQQRLEQQWDGDDNGAAETEAVGDRPVAKSRYHARGIASATTKPRGGRRSSRGSSDGGFRDVDSYGDRDTDARNSSRPSRQDNDEEEQRYSRTHATTLPPTTQGQHASRPRHTIGGGSTASLASDDGSLHDRGGSMDAFGVVQSTAQSRADVHGRDTGGGVAQQGGHDGGGGYNPARYGLDDEYRSSPSGAGPHPSSSSMKAHTTPRAESASSAGPAPTVAASPLAGVTQIPGYGKVVVSRREFGEGKTETVYTDGTRLFTYRNNTTRELTPEGHIIVRFHNGDIRKTHTDTGVEVYYFAEAKTTHTSFPDGSQLYEFPNGQVERHFPDSSKEIKYPDGTVKEVLPSGEMRSLFPDGTKLSEMPDGRKIIYGVDGSVQSEMMSPAAAGAPGGPGGARQ